MAQRRASWTEPTAPWEVLNVRVSAKPHEVRAAFLKIGAAAPRRGLRARAAWAYWLLELW